MLDSRQVKDFHLGWGDDQKDAGYGTSASKQNESMSVSVIQHSMVAPERGERIPRGGRPEHDAGA